MRDSAVAVDEASGTLYAIDDTQPNHTEESRARIEVFDAAGAYQGHLKYDTVDGEPTGLAVDNSAGATQRRVYVTTGNTHRGGVYAYAPSSATKEAPLAPKFHPALLGSGLLFPTVPIGGPGGAASVCEGDSCQILPPEPTDPTLTTLLSGHGNPKPRYARYNRRQRAKKKRKKRHHGSKKARARDSLSAAPASPVSPPEGAEAPLATAASGASIASPGGGPSSAAVLLPGAAGFDAAAWADGGEAATKAGSHPYQLDLALGLDQGGGEADLRSARIVLPPGLLLNPANGTGVLCSDAAFATPRTTPFAAGSESGESCPDQSQLGTVRVTSGIEGGKTRTLRPLRSAAALGLRGPLRRCPLRPAAHLRRRHPRRRPRRLHDPGGERNPRSPAPAGHGTLAVGRALGRLPQRRAWRLPQRGRTVLPLGQMLGRRAAHHQRPLAFLTSAHPVRGAARLRSDRRLLAAGGRAERGPPNPRPRSKAARASPSARIRRPALGREGLLGHRLRLPPLERRHLGRPTRADGSTRWRRG